LRKALRHCNGRVPVYVAVAKCLRFEVSHIGNRIRFKEPFVEACVLNASHFCPYPSLSKFAWFFHRTQVAYGSLRPCFSRNLGRTISIRGSVVARLLLIDVAGSIAILAVWYLVFFLYNRKKGAAALRWVHAACAGKGRILGSHWEGSSRLEARLHFPSRWFENARITVKLHPRSLPVHWLVTCCRHQNETLTFEADLGDSPSFQLEVVRHRWSAHNRGISSRRQQDREWHIYEPGPIILTTRNHWKQDPTIELNALMSARRQDILCVRFRPESPQFSATIHLEAMADPNAAAGLVSALREIAAGASAHRQ
jgi:hypothetical protein